MMVALWTTCCTPNSWLNSISRLCNNDKAPFWQSGPRFGRHQSRIRCSSCWRWARPSLPPGHLRIRCSNCWRWARPSLPPGHGRSSAEKCDDNDSGIQINAQGNTAIISACFVGLFTGISVVLFNAAVHEIRDFCWDGIPSRGASWLREEPIGVIWQRVILVPASGGLLVSFLNTFRATLDVSTQGNWTSSVKSVLRPVLKTIAACVTLGTGNSLGPEGPSVEIGTSVAKGIGALLDKGAHRKLSLKAAGSAAGISSGFNAAVAGCFFAVESVLWPSPAASLSLTNTTSMVILSAVIASVVSEIGLGSEPAFAVPAYDFRTPTATSTSVGKSHIHWIREMQRVG
ncbi:hypothetical protein H5410_009879 [Solanum commersonii]|uniref:Chloride channel protein n=1 Tax=Solanum commersonii TaxID=4109 RepID=A0A9J6AJ61_SOLCO|nr:hypothetical protein H5410_009879 [Solanum commersonii]